MQLFFAFLHNYETLIEVPNNFYSLNWTERAYDYGQFELQLYSDQPGYEYSLGNLFIRDDTDTVMVIETATVKQEDDGVYLHKYTGRSLESMMEWRILPHRSRMVSGSSMTVRQLRTCSKTSSRHASQTGTRSSTRLSSRMAVFTVTLLLLG